ncbi:crystal protein [Magnaporthiopsis poae ATCC 64411]|uniref:Carboxylic ester hydrolase n=1 Tax=Magnaporthiopsis poae (strain ATCC 64411 / 73-15) TaxID=644358 RepID=A0A0C4E715_MAGP6|nr:crystal protein [Magnaporthiopsis poae ATCC 64411]
MSSLQRCLLAVLLSSAFAAAVPSPDSLEADITLLIDNDLQGESSPSADSGVILLSGRDHTLDEANLGCVALGERLWAPNNGNSSIQATLNYLVYQQAAQNQSMFWISPPAGNGPRTISAGAGIEPAADGNLRLPALCTQSAPFSSPTAADKGQQWQVSVRANDEVLTGFRDRLSFRFLGIRYAPRPVRFNHSTPFEGNGGAAEAVDFGPKCVQLDDTGSEDCLFLNIWTPFLPHNASITARRGLRPVMLWIHGGAFTSGSGSDTVFDGGNMASRGDVVVVSINYRVGTLGFLALNDGTTNGNFGLADQINALNWVIKNIRSFGGDPSRITVFGQSAGAASVRALMASPKAIGKFAAAILMSNLGGLYYGATYSKYYTIAEQADAAVKRILDATGCAAAASQVDCLRNVPTSQFNTVAPARYLVVDGTYLTSSGLVLSPGPALPLRLMMGITRDDGAPFITYPNTSSQAEYLASLGIAAPPQPALFPIPDTTANATLNLYNATTPLQSSHAVKSMQNIWTHSGDLLYVFGNVVREGLPLRDDADLSFMQLVLDSFVSFARSYDPNPDLAFLTARGYASTLRQVQSSARWQASTAAGLTMRVLDWPPRQGPFRELAQCESLGLGLNYYING